MSYRYVGTGGGIILGGVNHSLLNFYTASLEQRGGLV